jgi:multiple sugar transport system ATP-binding protein
VSRVNLKGLQKRFGKVTAVDAVDLDIAQGEFCCFVGPSGCGKSTLLRLIAGLEAPSAGMIHIDDLRVDQLPPSRRGVAMVFQSYALYPHMTVYQNMAFGLQRAHLKKSVIRSRIEAAAAMLQIETLLDRLPKQLSGGQRQRVAIGRAIVREPGVFLFDEPLSNLDAALRQQTRAELARLHARLGATMIYVTHDQTEAMTLAHKIVVLRSGRVEQIGDPMTLYHRPANRFVAGFIGSPPMNFLPARLTSAAPNLATLKLDNASTLHARVDATAVSPGADVTIGFRPEHLLVGEKTQSSLPAKVTLCEKLGDHTLLLLTLVGDITALTAKVSPSHAAVAGDRVNVMIDPQHCHLFDGTGYGLPRTVSFQ